MERRKTEVMSFEYDQQWRSTSSRMETVHLLTTVTLLVSRTLLSILLSVYFKVQLLDPMAVLYLSY